MKIAISGATGRVGGALIRAIRQNDNFALGAAIASPNDANVGADIGQLLGIGQLGVPLSTIETAPLSEMDVMIDFTLAAGFRPILDRCRAENLPFVSGTTGLNQEDFSALEMAAMSIPVLWAANMSLGINLLYHIAATVGATLGDTVDTDIIEAHHRNKKDAPSGTALKLGEFIAQARGETLPALAVYDQSSGARARKPGDIGFSSIRAGDLCDHTLLFTLPNERLELTHRATDRSVFALGALKAAQWLIDKPAGRYEMFDVLGLKSP